MLEGCFLLTWREKIGKSGHMTFFPIVGTFWIVPRKKILAALGSTPLPPASPRVGQISLTPHPLKVVSIITIVLLLKHIILISGPKLSVRNILNYLILQYAHVKSISF